MIVKSLELSNFRNYENLSLEFSPSTNILYGDNAQGKTNILEAVFLCATTKSHKGSKDREIIKLQSEEAHIRMRINRDDVDHRLDMHLKKNKPKGVAIDGIPIKRSSELFGIINVVFFSPEDLSIIKNGPSERRRFIDMELCQLSKLYLHNLINYNKVLNQRNNLLKQIGFNKSLLDTLYVWDQQLIHFGSALIKERDAFMKSMNELIIALHKKLSDGKEELEIVYEASVAESEFENKLKKSMERDIALKVTNVGPHRDDLSFLINGQDVRKYGSQGQQRTAALSLKLAEIELVKQVTKDKPILLLDDVLSELDRKRQNQLLDSIVGIQTIVTCTGLEEFVNNRIETDRIYKVIQGTVEKG
ncbi:DNA replication/repair protein RecF [Lachnoclostridium phytofermentans]|uniref:DNA replication and repair protein RecF n=1 Tax=Lachnoclostridium phytofermentans (strain ATCC 700394 / DSM 18823 / ISDg) TaxID=357809 RepID=RECF_LACP7|nr:DNA replication/repair protein RecF [Lachnoclostridium phytofermentans]A9KPP4.1 RecName: Full=DNA replication and repair protein RecF [Lachnoclostridium phytofermentans ISDg]ABX40395.1 DNA replication and repair protein RecF [Lachnoclostridium phytofermentans ISDg]